MTSIREKSSFHRFIPLFLCLWAFNPLYSQDGKYTLKISFDKSESWLNKINYRTKFRDSLEMNNEISAVQVLLYKNSLLSASVDSVNCLNSACTAYFFVGDKLGWARLDQGNVEEEVLSKTGYRDKIFHNSPFRYRQFGRFVERIIGYYENSGYPFASLSLKDIRHEEKGGINARLHLEKNLLINVDTIEIYGEYIISEKFLYNYLDVKPHKPYNEENIRAVSSKLDDLTYVDEDKPANVIFTETETRLQLFLRRQRASRFDGIIGVLQDEESGEVQLTGDVKLGLANSFKRGELIGLNWRGLPGNTQDLKFKFNFPYLLNSPFGIDLDLRLYKRDTTFLEIQSAIGLQYFINSRDYLKVFYQNHRSNLLSTGRYENSTTTPEVLDFNTNLYGAELSLNKLDYLLNPTRGFRFEINGRAGYKSILKNPGLGEELYGGIELRNSVFRSEAGGAVFLPLAQRHVVMIANLSAYLRNNQILRNELYRIGGLKTLRGFNEETIFVSSYAINTLEYRFILEKNSNLNLFVDYAYTETRMHNSPDYFDTPYGIGIGSTFETGAGIFSVSYAIGKQKGTVFDYRSAKIHFGFLNYF